MNDLLKQDHHHRLIKMILDHYGASFFHKKRILDLGCGDGGMALAISRLQPAEVVCCDARESHLATIRKKYPHLKTVCADLNNSWPFKDHKFDLVLSIDLMSHLENYEKHINDILSVSENVVLETQTLNSVDPGIKFIIDEPAVIAENSFHGKGVIVSSRTIENLISELNARYKRISETKLNSNGYNYDWVDNGAGPLQHASHRRFWFIRGDKFLNRKIRSHQELKLMQGLASSPHRPYTQLKHIALCLYGDFSIENLEELKLLHAKYDIFVHSFDKEMFRKIQSTINPISISTDQNNNENSLVRDAFAIHQINELRNNYEQACQSIYDLVIFKKLPSLFSLENIPFFKGYQAKFLPSQGVIANSMVADIIALIDEYIDEYRAIKSDISLEECIKKHLEEFSVPLLS